MERDGGGERPQKNSKCAKLDVSLYAFQASVTEGQNRESGRRDGGKWMVWKIFRN